MNRADKAEQTIRHIMRMAHNLTLDELLDLRFDLEERIEQLRNATDAPAPPGRAQAQESTKTVREEWKRCNKPGCKCAEGDLHGPYLYEYWKEQGRTRSRYIGKGKK